MRRVALLLAGVLTLAVMAPPPAAQGQIMGLYYQEVEKDGRVYVFNTPEKYALWQQSGDMGVAITLIGRGPNGETVVAENETAIDLYLFRHNLPGYDRPTPKPATPVYDPGAWYNKMKVSGYIFGDAYAITDHHLQAAKDVDGGFWMRRAYLTADYTFNKQFTSRLRLEMNSPGNFTDAASAMNPFVKDAYLNYKYSDAFSAIAGISPPPTFEVIENFWGYRSVEKTPVDLQRMQGSRDFGLGFKGGLAGGSLKYHFMAGNGGAQAQETNDGKAYYLSLGWYPTANFFVEGYVDTEERAAEEERDMYQGFVGYRGGWGRVGAQYTSQTRTRPGVPDVDIDLVSGFVVFTLNPKLNILARYDNVMDPNPGASGIAYLPMVNTAESQLYIVGVDWLIGPKVNLIPNIEHVQYKSVTSAADPEDDTLVRLTLYFTF